MAGPNLEVFKFGIYVFFPVMMMLHYGNPDWYAEHVKPYRERFWPPEETTNKPPTNAVELRSELDRLRLERMARKAAKPTSQDP